MPVKWLGIALIFILCNGWGLWMASRLQARPAILAGVREMVSDMRAGMGMLLYTPGQWLERYRQRASHPFIRAMLDALGREILDHPADSMIASWEKAVAQSLSQSIYAAAMTAQDASVLRQVGGHISASDAGTLIDHLAYADVLVERQRKEAEDECRRKKGMFLRMGFLLGLASVIILA